MRWATINGVFFQCLKDRSSRPYRQPKRTDAALEQLILDLRARTNLGPARLSHIMHLAPSTILKVLKRHGKSRGACAPRPITRRYECLTGTSYGVCPHPGSVPTRGLSPPGVCPHHFPTRPRQGSCLHTDLSPHRQRRSPGPRWQPPLDGSISVGEALRRRKAAPSYRVRVLARHQPTFRSTRSSSNTALSSSRPPIASTYSRRVDR